ncbi:hypothetical protein, partial [Ralstonia solanacearum]|uniref:hypothetical protein n=1 Tax=Ralstonia solanacearum TaxID=305 RepID=UPI00230618D5
ISVSGHDIKLPGIGSYISLAIQQQNLHAIGWAIVAMLIGPLRLKAYCMPIMALPHQLAARVLSVGTPCTLI